MSRHGRPRKPRSQARESERDQLEGRNVVLEALSRKRRRVELVWLDERAKPDKKVKAILDLCAEQSVRLERVPRQKLDGRSQTGVHNGVIGWAQPLPSYSVAGLLNHLADRGELPFVVVVDEVSYEHNLGAILRSALGSGVNGVIVPSRRGKGLSPVVQRIAMGGAEEVPVVREGLSAALATLRRAGVRVVGADMGGTAYWQVPMTGALAVVLGGEGKGLSPALKKRCDAIVSVPLAAGLDSLNVSVTAGILLFEKVRQEQLG